jgi:hypothetical protein
VVIIDPTWEMMASSVISQPVGVIAELSAIAKIYKYKGLHERHHFIPIAVEVHDTPRCDMWIVSSRSVLVFSTIDD